MRQLRLPGRSFQADFRNEMVKNIRFSPETQSALQNAGWFQGRQVDTGAWRASLPGVHMHAAAERFLQEFGGLHVQSSGPGEKHKRTPFEIDPNLAIGEDDRWLELSQMFDRAFFPIGGEDFGEFFLGIDEEGEIYFLMNWAISLGRGDYALENLVRGLSRERLVIDEQAD
ncbi:SUKH-3 domain-containing protein [Streptomyces sp. NE5-10]|uniref:SUKH-3 domain-containing protein n=1 Tax=Streptomyces sp. NE5-10 TaxID=2759674 RepID=UPI001903D257|nr:SUKH-3 domain-containing protein [Streptomyces sp. NE5-10]